MTPRRSTRRVPPAVPASDSALDDLVSQLPISPPQPSARGRGSRGGRGRGRGRGGGTRGAAPSSTIPHEVNEDYGSGSRQISFQVDLNPMNSAGVAPATSRQPRPGLSAVIEDESGANAESEWEDAPHATGVDEDNPFIVTSEPRTPVHIRRPISLGAETFPSPSPTSSTRSPAPHAAPRLPTSTPSRARGSPRAGPHAVAPVVPHRLAESTKRRIKAADVWTYFKHMNGRRECIFCQLEHAQDPTHEIRSWSETTGPTGLRLHLAESHLAIWMRACKKFRTTIVEASNIIHILRKHHTTTTFSDADSRSNIRQYSPEAFLDAIVEFIVANDQSLNVIESPQLRAIFLMLREELRDSDIPHRTAVRNHIQAAWDRHIASLEEDMKNALGKVSTTMDLWSNPNLAPFMAVTAHWIETTAVQTSRGPQYELNLRSDLIGFNFVPGSHTGKHLAHTFLFVLDRIGITPKLGYLTMDNASNNDTCMLELEAQLRVRGITFDHVKNRIRCFPHIVNLGCKSVLTAITDLVHAIEPQSAEHEASNFERIDDDPIATLRNLIRSIRASSLRCQHFQAIASQHKTNLELLRDVDIRWSSTYLMIYRAIVLEDVIKDFLNSGAFNDIRQRCSLSAAEWDALDTVCSILKIPFKFQQALSAEKTPTLCNTIASFNALITGWKNLQTKLAQNNPGGAEVEIAVIQAGIDKLEEYFSRTDSVPAYTIAMILNPALKLSYYQKHEPQKLPSVRNLFKHTLQPYYVRRNPQHRQPLDEPQVPATIAAVDYTPARPRRNPRLRRALVESDDDSDNEAPQPGPQAASLEDEINAYLLDIHVGTSALAFWQENQLRYPTLFLAALDYLAIQGSAVPCERVFSSAKETTTNRRSNMGHTLMEMLQMMKFSFKQGRSINFTAGTSQEELEDYLMNAAEVSSPASEDINTYIRRLLSETQL